MGRGRIYTKIIVKYAEQYLNLDSVFLQLVGMNAYQYNGKFGIEIHQLLTISNEQLILDDYESTIQIFSTAPQRLGQLP